MADSPIPLAGPLFPGRAVDLGWPEPHEYDRITALRNRPAVRERFLDPRPLDLERNREWLARGMRRPFEAVLSIRLRAGGAFAGAIGWSGYDRSAGTFEMGRVMVDTAAVLPYRDRLPPGYEGVAADAGVAVRDYAFGRMGDHYEREIAIRRTREGAGSLSTRNCPPKTGASDKESG